MISITSPLACSVCTCSSFFRFSTLFCSLHFTTLTLTSMHSTVLYNMYCYLTFGKLYTDMQLHTFQGRRSGYESGGGGIHVNPERSFGGTNGEPPSEASQLRKGGPGALPWKISKTYMANGAIYVIPELYL